MVDRWCWWPLALGTMRDNNTFHYHLYPVLLLVCLTAPDSNLNLKLTTVCSDGVGGTRQVLVTSTIFMSGGAQIGSAAPDSDIQSTRNQMDPSLESNMLKDIFLFPFISFSSLPQFQLVKLTLL